MQLLAHINLQLEEVIILEINLEVKKQENKLVVIEKLDENKVYFITT